MTIQLNNIRYWQQCIVCAIFFGHTLIQLFICNIINIEITGFLSINAGVFGSLSSSMLYTMSFILIPVGLLFDVYSTRHLLIFAACLCAISNLLIVINLSIETFVINRIFCGIANVMAFIGGLKLINAVYTKQLSLASGLFLGIGNVSGILVNMPYLWFKNTYSWETLLLLNAFIGILVLLIVKYGLLTVPDKNIKKSDNGNVFKEVINQLKSAMTSINNWLCGIFAGICCLPDFLLVALWGILYLKQKHLFSEVESGAILSCFAFGIVLGSPLMGWLSGHIQRIRSIMVISSFMSVLFLLVVMEWINPSFYFFAIVFFILGILSSSSLFAFVSIQISSLRENLATSIAFATLIMNFISAFGQSLFGWFIQLKWDGLIEHGKAIYSNEALDSAFLILPCSFLLAGVIAFFIKSKPSSKLNFV